MFYWPLVSFLWFVTHVFFRRIEVVGTEHIPEDGAVIFCGNHPNSLIDPVLIITHCQRRVSFAAKDTLFKNPLWKVLFSLLGCVPIKRRSDHGGKADNERAFERLFDVLRRGGTFGIFPEGISSFAPELAPLKTGAARIGLGAATSDMPVRIVPCGLSYRRRERLRSRVLIQFGEAITIDQERLRSHDENERAEVVRLTEEIETCLRALTINAPDFDTLRVLDGVRRLYRPDNLDLSMSEHAEISRRFMDNWEKWKDEPEVAALYDDVSKYLYELDALGLSDHDLARPLRKGAWLWRIVRHVLFLAVAVPLALPGAIIHAPILLLTLLAGSAGVIVTNRRDMAGIMKMTTATILVVAVYGAIVFAIFYFIELPAAVWVSILVVLVLLASGWALIRVLERQSIVRKLLVSFSAVLHLPDEMQRMCKRREALRATLLTLVDRFYDGERIVTQDSPEVI